jgi:RNA polymerase sigma-70 factor, ECF subfamily
MNPPTEQVILQGARDFNLTTLSEIFDQYSPGIFRYAMRLLGNENLSEDCVSETFLRFLKALRSGQGPKDHLMAYLYRIAHNWITDSYRKQSPQMVEVDENMEDTYQSHLEGQVDHLLEQDQIRSVLRKLTPDQRLVISLRFLEGWENEEIAVTLNRPVGAIKALQHRAILSFRKVMLQEEKD